MPTLYALSISHKKAPLNIREAFSLDETATKQFLYELRNVLDIAEALVISTCNRTEVYYLADNEQSYAIIRLLCLQKNMTNFEEIATYFEIFDNEATAAKHLFRVAIGLESQVVGDLQIPNQVKHAYQWTADVQMAGAFLHRLMHSIFYTNKKITQETAFRDGAASTSYATVELIETLTADITTPKILVLGLGEIGGDVCKNLAQRNFTDISICNRTEEKAQILALECGFSVVQFENVWQNIAQADVIIASIATETPFINKNTLQNALEKTLGTTDILSYKYFIDLAVPRSVAEDVENIVGTIVYNIDNIQMRANEAMRKRLQAIPHVEKLIEEALEEFSNWTQEMEVSPTINKLKNALEQIRKEEISRFVKELTPLEEEIIDKISKNMMQKIIKLPVIQLKAACKRGEANTLIDVLNDLFDLEK